MRRALELMWDSYVAGSYPVGAVLTDGAGQIVLEGRNHAGETNAAPGVMFGTVLGHAEMSVMAQLPPEPASGTGYSQHILWTTLEPCLLCQSAAIMSHVGHVTFLAADAICVGLDRLVTINEHAARRYPKMTGPADCVEARVASILPIAVLSRAPGGWASDFRRTHSPADTAVGERIAAEGLWPDRDGGLDDAIAHIVKLL